VGNIKISEIALTAVATAVSLLIVDLVVPGVDLANFPSALIAALAIGFLNSSVKPVVNKLSLPLNFATLGGFSLIINSILFWLAAVLVPGFRVQGLIAFLVGPVVLSLTNTFISRYFAEKGLELPSTNDTQTFREPRIPESRT
jgi:putative membrane protein